MELATKQDIEALNQQLNKVVALLTAKTPVKKLEPYYSFKDLSTLWKFNERTIAGMLKNIPATTFGKTKRYSQTALENWLNQNTTASSTEMLATLKNQKLLIKNK